MLIFGFHVNSHTNTCQTETQSISKSRSDQVWDGLLAAFNLRAHIYSPKTWKSLLTEKFWPPKSVTQVSANPAGQGPMTHGLLSIAHPSLEGLCCAHNLHSTPELWHQQQAAASTPNQNHTTWVPFRSLPATQGTTQTRVLSQELRGKPKKPFPAEDRHLAWKRYGPRSKVLGAEGHWGCKISGSKRDATARPAADGMGQVSSARCNHN